MATKQAGIILHHVRKILAAQETDRLSDRELLWRFAQERDEAAFATLVRRHGPMVLHGCQRILHNWHDAEDAFQATFLVLARKAASRKWDESVGTWLYLVAHRLALKVRAGRARRLQQNTRAVERLAEDPQAVASDRELRGLLDEELSRLPEHCRAPLVLCGLEGLTRDEAARQLGWSLGTFRRRLEQGRALLRQRLVRRGLPLSALFAAVLGTEAAAQAALPVGLAQSAVQTAMRTALGKALPPALVSVRTAALAEGVLKGMYISKLKIALVTVLVMGVAGAGAGLALQRTPAVKPTQEQQPDSRSSAMREAGGNSGPEQPRVALDRYGDPLPREAISRLGTVRMQHGGFTGLVRFTPDGKSLVSVGGDGIRAWDVATGKQIHCLPAETMGGSHWQGVSLSPDGRQVVTANKAGIHIWDLATASQVRGFATEEHFRVCYSPDGQVIAALPSKVRNKVDLLDANTGQRLWSWSGLTHQLVDVAFTADGKNLITAGTSIEQSLTEHTIRFLDVETGKEQRHIDLGTRKPERVALSPDGALVAVICSDEKGHRSEISVFEVAGGKERFQLVQPGPGTHGQQFFSALTFAPDGKSLFTAGGEGSLIVWDVATGKELRRLGRHMTNSHDITFSPDGKAVAVANCGRIRVIDRGSGEELLPTTGNHNVVAMTAITADGQTIGTSIAGSVVLWNPVTGQERQRLESDQLRVFYMLADDGRTAFSMESQEKAVLVWDLTTGKERSRMSVDFLGKLPTVKGIWPGGKLLVVGTFTGDTVYLMDSTTGKLVRSFPDPGRMVAHVDITAGGRTLVTFRDDHSAQMWDIATGARLRQIGPMGKIGAVGTNGWGAGYAATLSPDDKWLVYGCREYLSLYDVATGQETHRLTGLPSEVHTAKFSPDSRVLAWASGNDIHLLEVASGKERHSFAGHRGSILALSFSADGKTLVSGSSDYTALVWDLTGQLGKEETARKPLSPAGLDACWTALADADAARAYGALRKLAASPIQAIPFLRERLRPVEPADEKHLAVLIGDLDNPRFPVREKAAKELESLGEVVIAACRKALERQPHLEVRRRLEALIEKQSQEWKNPSTHNLRNLRALEVLELTGTQQARQVLEALAKGTPEARLTQEAKAALERLAKRLAAMP